jgi:hypothetical protein
MRKILIGTFFIIILLFPNCEKEKKNSQDCEYVFCTEIYKSIDVLIRHLNTNIPVVLTSYKVIKTSDNSIIRVESGDFTANNGYYLIVADNLVQHYKNSTFEVEFQGYINNSEVVQTKLVIYIDCCHVNLVSGAKDLFI